MPRRAYWNEALAAVGLIAVRSAAPALRRAIVVAAGCLGAAFVLASSAPTPLHTLLYAVLPGFARLHPHVSERVLIVAYLGLALLAGLPRKNCKH